MYHVIINIKFIVNINENTLLHLNLDRNVSFVTQVHDIKK